MYLNEYFTENERHEIEGLIQAYPLATLVLSRGDDVNINAIPMIQHEDAFIGHVALANAVHRFDPVTAVAIFQGPEGYISPQWYPSKADHHRHVPTWNYQMVQVFGEIEFDHDEALKRRYVHLLTQHFEEGLSHHTPWQMADAPEDFMAQKLGNIVALTLKPTKVLAKSKLSQNRDLPDAENVKDQLMRRDQKNLSAAMGRSLQNRKA